MGLSPLELDLMTEAKIFENIRENLDPNFIEFIFRRFKDMAYDDYDLEIRIKNIKPIRRLSDYVTKPRSGINNKIDLEIFINEDVIEISPRWNDPKKNVYLYEKESDDSIMVQFGNPEYLDYIRESFSAEQVYLFYTHVKPIVDRAYFLM